jgi:uncharacterized protein (DUF2336 family)
MDGSDHNFKLILTTRVQSERLAPPAMTGEVGQRAREPSMTKFLPAPPCFKPNIVRRFLAWAQTADADARAQGASALARAYLYSGLPASIRAEAMLAMTVLLDDSSILVRRALAEALCRANDAPRALVLALAADESEAAAPVLQHSPMLIDADLADCVASGDVVAQIALARRANLPPRTKAALAESGQFDAVRALIANFDIELPAELLQSIFARFGDDPSLRDALLERPALPAALRARIVVAAAKDLAVEAAQWMSPSRAERVAREARDQAICTIASSCRPDERTELTRALRAAGALTPALLLRSLLGGERTLFSEALAELSGLPAPRVAAFILEPYGEGFAALARRAGLKGGVLLAFRAALAAIKAQGAEGGDSLKLPLVQRVIDTCEQLDDPALAKVRTLLWRFAAEAAKAEAAHFAREAAAQASVGRHPRVLEFSSVNDDEDRAPKLIADFSRTPVRAPPLELDAPPKNPSGDYAPRVELPPERVARLDDAA